jgi:hypothetical protein
LDGFAGDTALNQSSEFVTVAPRIIPIGNQPSGVSLSTMPFEQKQKQGLRIASRSFRVRSRGERIFALAH